MPPIWLVASNLHFAAPCRKQSICEWLLLWTVVYRLDLKPIDVMKKKNLQLTATMFTFFTHAKTPLKPRWQNKTSTSASDCPQPTGRERTFCRVSRLNMNYPYKLSSWRVKAMTVVAQRRCAKDVDWRGHWQYNETVISRNDTKWLYLQKTLAYKVRLPEKKKKNPKKTINIRRRLDSTSAFGAIYKTTAAGVQWGIHVCRLVSFFGIQDVEST